MNEIIEILESCRPLVVNDELIDYLIALLELYEIRRKSEEGVA